MRSEFAHQRRDTTAAKIERLEPRRLLAAVPPPVNVVLTTDPDVQQQPSIAVDPSAPSHVVTVYTDRALVDTGFAGLGVARSVDAGQTWSRSSVPIPAGYEQGAAYPIARFDD